MRDPPPTEYSTHCGCGPLHDTTPETEVIEVSPFGNITMYVPVNPLPHGVAVTLAVHVGGGIVAQAASSGSNTMNDRFMR
jgi:hypothetical protein